MVASLRILHIAQHRRPPTHDIRPHAVHIIFSLNPLQHVVAVFFSVQVRNPVAREHALLCRGYRSGVAADGQIVKRGLAVVVIASYHRAYGVSDAHVGGGGGDEGEGCGEEEHPGIRRGGLECRLGGVGG
jgi:hypothetical protein